jgi:hypothetical protein
VYNRGTSTHIFIAALFTRARWWNQHKCPLTDEWKKMWDTHWSVGIQLFGHTQWSIIWP